MKAPRHKPDISPEEWRRLQELNSYERAARQQGYKYIAGIDEAGRGPLAGPVLAAACLIPEDVFLPGIDDSKQLSALQRESLFETIVSNPWISYAIASASHQEIDQHNIYQSSILAMLRAVESLPQKPDYLLVDGMKLPGMSIPCEKIVAGDSKSQSIAAASVLAKVTRDRLMKEYHLQWPQYGFDKHKGYGTPQHLEALKTHGPCLIHRLTFEPLKSALQKQQKQEQDQKQAN
jgi:ribonuclease HII